MKPAPVNVPRLESFARENLAAAIRAFQSAPQLALRQAWREKEEADIAPGLARVGWQAKSLLVLAELSDADIFTRAKGENEFLWELGDAFEIFLRPEGQTAYLEFHVAPNNRRMQMRFADADVVVRLGRTRAFGQVLVSETLFSSMTWVQTESKRWFVLAEVPAASVCEKSGPIANSEWHFSFSRYDYTHGREKPVISSTSAHTQPKFHRQDEWGLLRFVP